MCGISGFVDFGNVNYTPLEILARMANKIYHRGPDSDGFFVSNDFQCGLAFRRLAIIDLSANGNQPMYSKDKRYSIVFNGEIYNHTEIRKELQGLGYIYNSNTDTETILYGYMQWGEKIVDKLRGMWAIAIWDDHRKEIFLSRDRIGIKPFYYYKLENGIIFSSEIKSILEHPKVKKAVNLDEIPNYLNFGTSSNYSTLFQNIKKLTASHYLKFSQKQFSITEYWNPLSNSVAYANETLHDVQANIIKLLRESVAVRMMSDVPFGVFLSGGIDSSLNVALMSELMNRPVDTFTVGFKDLEQFNELEYANVIVKKYNTNHHQLLIDQAMSLESLDDIVYHLDEPNADPVCIPLYFLSELTRKSGTIVVQVGEGSDEQFVGYKWMLRDYKFYNSYWKFYNSMPKFIKSSFYTLSSGILGGFGEELAWEYLRRASNNEEMSWSGVPIISRFQQEKLFKNQSLLGNSPWQYAKELYREIQNISPKSDYLQKINYLELRQRIGELLNMRIDKMTMAHSIEARVPFLDHKLIEYTMGLPEHIRMPNTNEPKYLLKKAVEGILPNDIIYRKKMGFAAPVQNWLSNQWYSYAKNEILNSFYVKEGFFDKNFVLNMFDQLKKGSKSKANEIYSLLMLSIHHRQNFL